MVLQNVDTLKEHDEDSNLFWKVFSPAKIHEIFNKADEIIIEDVEGGKVPSDLKAARREEESQAYAKEFKNQEEYLEKHKMSVDEMKKMLGYKKSHHHHHHDHDKVESDDNEIESVKNSRELIRHVRDATADGAFSINETHVEKIKKIQAREKVLHEDMDRMIHQPTVQKDDFTRYEKFKEAMGLKPKSTNSVLDYLKTYKNMTAKFGENKQSGWEKHHQPHHLREHKEFYDGEEVTENSTYHLIEGKFDPFPYNNFNYDSVNNVCKFHLHKMRGIIFRLYKQKECETVELKDRTHKHGMIRVLENITPEDELMKHVEKAHEKLHDPEEILTDDIDEHLVDETLNKLWKDLAKDGMVDPRSLSRYYADQYLPSEIPNLYHYIWFGCKEFTLVNFISMISVLKIANPVKIIFHTDCEPVGNYWQTVKCFAGDRLIVATAKPPKTVWSNDVSIVEHQTDIYKLMVLLHIGGVYIDSDFAIIRPVHPQLSKNRLAGEHKHPLIPVFGEETSYSLSNGFIMSPPGSIFLKRLYWEYQHYKPSHGFGTFSVINDWAMWRKHQSEVHVVKNKIARPSSLEQTYLFKCIIDWSQNYNINLSQKSFKRWIGKPAIEWSMDDLSSIESTLGEISRYILWGRFQAVKENC